MSAEGSSKAAKQPRLPGARMNKRVIRVGNKQVRGML